MGAEVVKSGRSNRSLKKFPIGILDGNIVENV